MLLRFAQLTLLLFLALLMVAALLTTRPVSAEPYPVEQADDARVCATLAHAAETALGIPSKLVLAVGVIESGRYDKSIGRAEPWPWTINAEGKGYRFRSKAEAILAVEKLQAAGVRSIDVGCMQVNLSYHGDAFADLEEAFDPVMNTAYGAHFLNTLRDERGTWSKAVAAYHSSNPERGVPYRRKVAKAWIALRGEIEQAVATDNSRRARISAAYKEQREAFEARQAELVRVQEAKRSIRLWPEIAPPDSGAMTDRGLGEQETSEQDGPAGQGPPLSAEPPPEATIQSDDKRADVEPETSAQDCSAGGNVVDAALIDAMRELSGLDTAEGDAADEDVASAEPASEACPRVIEAKPAPKRHHRRSHGVTIIRG